MPKNKVKLIAAAVTIVIAIILSVKLTHPDSAPGCIDCNVILISLDTLRADRMSLYGYSRNTTPNIDELAKKSIVFTQTYSNAYFTLPSHMSIFTSLYPLTHNINYALPNSLGPQMKTSESLEQRYKTLGEIMAEEGYNTIWSADLNEENLNLDKGFGRGFNETHNSFLKKDTRGLESGLVTLKKILSENKEKKFFMFMHSNINHDPYIYPEMFDDRFISKNYDGIIPRTNSELTSINLRIIKKYYENASAFSSEQQNVIEKAIKNAPKGQTEVLEKLKTADINEINTTVNFGVLDIYRIEKIMNLSEEDISVLNDMYDNGVYYADYAIARVMHELNETGLLDKTIIIITSDHGEEIMEHGRFGHIDFYDHTIHVPLVIYVPGMKKGITINKLTQSIDIVPTLLPIINISSPTQAQGKNMLNKENDNKYAYGYSLGDEYIKTKEWKYMKRYNGKEELYYLPLDPREKSNLISSEDEKIKEEKNILRDELLRWELNQQIS